MSRRWGSFCLKSNRRMARNSFFLSIFLMEKNKKLRTSQSHCWHETFLGTENGKSLRHQIESGNGLRCMEDEPGEEHELTFKNTQGIIVISSALKAFITAVVKKKEKKLLRTPKIPLRKIQRKETPQQNRGVCFCEWVIGPQIWKSVCNILFRRPLNSVSALPLFVLGFMFR